MNKYETPDDCNSLSHREMLTSMAATIVVAMTGTLVTHRSFAQQSGNNNEMNIMGNVFPGTFVYSEFQISLPFDQAPWRDINKQLQRRRGLLSKTWLAGTGNQSLGGFYAFDSLENARQFVTGELPGLAKNLGAAPSSRLFDASLVKEASRDMGSPFFGGVLSQAPGAFVYTEVQVSVPFGKAPWRKRNPVLKQQPGLLAKTWFSGLNTQTLGGIDVFDSLANARRFALEDFPKTARRLGAAFETRIFDAAVTEKASRQMRSPFYV